MTPPVPTHAPGDELARKGALSASSRATPGVAARGAWGGRGAGRRPALAALLLVVPSLAAADGQWLTARGRLVPTMRLEVFGGARSVGAGAVQADGPDARAGYGGELSWAVMDRVAEARGSRIWQLTGTRLATVSATVGATAYVVPEGRFDVGLGPWAGLTLSLGGSRFTVDVGLQTGVDLFLWLDVPRLPQRALLGLNFTFGDFTLGVAGRTGVDLMPGRWFVVRAEAVLSLGWLGAQKGLAARAQLVTRPHPEADQPPTRTAPP